MRTFHDKFIEPQSQQPGLYRIAGRVLLRFHHRIKTSGFADGQGQCRVRRLLHAQEPLNIGEGTVKIGTPTNRGIGIRGETVKGKGDQV
jgi:hypothetical protein